jgi:proteic killer suppression protein
MFYFHKNAQKQLKKAPIEIQKKVLEWVKMVKVKGLFLTRRAMKGLHDEPLHGERKHQRSIRLNKQWRLIYEERTHEIIEVQEITPHDYRTR